MSSLHIFPVPSFTAEQLVINSFSIFNNKFANLRIKVFLPVLRAFSRVYDDFGQFIDY